MLTRLYVDGFKNLVDTDIRFGPFTCIAGTNAVGKSNVFDAIAFLSALADHVFLDAAAHVRDTGSVPADPGAIFTRVENRRVKRMSIQADMLIPRSGADDLGQLAEASATYVSYRIELGLREAGLDGVRHDIELLSEKLSYIRKEDARSELGFGTSTAWIDSVVIGGRTKPLISEERREDGTVLIHLHQDQRQGRIRKINAETLPRTVLSTVTAEYPTAALVRNELRSWRRLQLEPTAMRAPDALHAPTSMDVTGQHMPATLLYLSHFEAGRVAEGVAPDLAAQIAARVSRLVEDIRTVSTEVDPARNSITLVVESRDATRHPARDLSDGTLRFLALSMMEADPRVGGLVCLEEPENGIHPERMVAMVALLEDLAVDPSRRVSSENPLRQVIINTHSPIIAALVKRESLLVARRVNKGSSAGRVASVSLFHLRNGWRDRFSPKLTLSLGALRAFMRPTEDVEAAAAELARTGTAFEDRVVSTLRFGDQQSLFDLQQ